MEIKVVLAESEHIEANIRHESPSCSGSFLFGRRLRCPYPDFGQYPGQNSAGAGVLFGMETMWLPVRVIGSAERPPVRFGGDGVVIEVIRVADRLEHLLIPG